MNTQVFIFHIQGNGRWVMEADRVFEGDINLNVAISDYAEGVFPIPTFGSHSFPTAAPAESEWRLH